jgi:negative regulator of replication initiation
MKIITLSDEAYARIEAEKRVPGESKSDVVLRVLQSQPPEPVRAGPWRRLACTSSAEREELHRIAAVIEDEFERIEPEDAE